MKKDQPHKVGHHISDTFLFQEFDSMEYRIKKQIEGVKKALEKVTPRSFDESSLRGKKKAYIECLRAVELGRKKIELEFEREALNRGDGSEEFLAAWKKNI